MKKTSGAPGVVSYAGLDQAKLLEQAEAAFARRPGGMPARFATLLPLFPVELVQDMPYVGVDAARPGRATAEGFAISLSEYHRLMHQQEPSLYVGDNLRRCMDRDDRFNGRGVVTVDREWAQRFPQYQQFLGEKLTLHLIGGGAQAVAVPESLHPRGGGLLRRQEQSMGVQSAARLYAQYAVARIRQGESYDPAAFAADYVQAAGLAPVSFSQAELGRVLQEIGICRSVENGEEAQIYTENSRRVEGVRQYVRMYAACDVFEPATVSKATARLFQLCFDDEDYVSDLWLPYGELLGYLDRPRGTVSAAALCEGCQIAPRYDAATLGGRYPDRLRVVTVVDRDLRLMMSDVLNNPAYGSGMNPLGMIVKQVALADSRELLRQGKLRLESCPFTVENTEVPTRIFLEQLALARLQEHKGRLVDAMVRREAALAQLPPGASRQRASEQLSQRVARLADMVRAEAARHTLCQMSGYDADIDYLRKRFAAWQEGGEYPLDPQRQASIECGYVLRGACEHVDYDALHIDLPEEKEPEEPAEAQPSQSEPKVEAVAEVAAATDAAVKADAGEIVSQSPTEPPAAIDEQSMHTEPDANIAKDAATNEAAAVEATTQPAEPEASAPESPPAQAAQPEALAQAASSAQPEAPAPLATPGSPAPKRRKTKSSSKSADKPSRTRAEQITFDQLPEPVSQLRFDTVPALGELARRNEPPKPAMANKQGPMAALAQETTPAGQPRKPQNMQELLQQLLSK